jgi:parallel beta-helix repeat protein
MGLFGAAFVVTNQSDYFPGSLHAAVAAANATPEMDRIVFNLPITGLRIPLPYDGRLPIITAPVEIDGNTQPNPGGRASVELFSNINDRPSDGIVIKDTTNCVIRGLTLRGFPGIALHIIGGGGHIIQGNYVGTDINGTTARGNLEGIWVENSVSNLIGGALPGQGNVISANTYRGIFFNQSSYNWALGNFLGTDASGTATLNAPFSASGFVVGIMNWGWDNVIGGLAPGEGNVISGNPTGIWVPSGYSSIIAGNLIGLDRTGRVPLPNARSGILVFDGNVIVSNVVSCSVERGIFLGTSSNICRGNLVGTDINGRPLFAYQQEGILVAGGPSNIVGGSEPYEQNIVHGNIARAIVINGSQNQIVGNDVSTNGGDGILIVSGTDNVIRQNSIHDNGGLGISLGGQAADYMDFLDLDSGPNGLQNHPILQSATLGADRSLRVMGTLGSRPGLQYVIDAYANVTCDASGRGEGRHWLAAIDLTTDSNGHSRFTLETPIPPDWGSAGFSQITATATDPSGNTSEFSPCITVVVEIPLQLVDLTLTENGLAFRFYGLSGRSYQVQSASSIFGPWTNSLPMISGQGQWQPVTLPVLNVPELYHRMAHDP